MTPGPVGHEDATPMGTPVPVGQCPHCQAFLWVTLRGHAPTALPAGIPAGPSGCCDCPQCGARIYVSLGRLAPLAQPHKPRATALVPKTNPKLAETEKIKGR